MAIQINLPETNIGISFTNAYVRATEIAVAHSDWGADPKFEVTIIMEGYATNPTGTKLNPIWLYRYVTDLANIEAQTDATFLGRVYQWAMTQAELSGGTAC